MSIAKFMRLLNSGGVAKCEHVAKQKMPSLSRSHGSNNRLAERNTSIPTVCVCECVCLGEKESA